MDNDFAKRISNTAFAFRGYNVTNMGRTPELLRHPKYGPYLRRHLERASTLYSEATGRKVNLVSRVRRKAKSSLKTYARDLAMVVAVEMAQIEILKDVFDVPFDEAKLSFGYSLGEIAALANSGMYEMETLMRPILRLSKDAAELAATMGVLFSRGPALDLLAIRQLCLQISNKGDGVIDVSSYLSPNTVLLLGQGTTIDEFKRTMHDVLPKTVHLRKNPHRWPPLHTCIVRQRHIPDRAAVMLDTAPGGFTLPQPPVLSCVTGDFSYNELNSRDLLHEWVDHPQQVWLVLQRVLSEGVERMVHVGPEPNILPSTLMRLSNNVQSQLAGRGLAKFGLRAMSRIVRRHRSWLKPLITDDATLLRAPFVEQVVLEDWLLDEQVSADAA